MLDGSGCFEVPGREGRSKAAAKKTDERAQKHLCVVEVLPAGIVPTDIFTPTNPATTVAIIPMQQRKPFLVDSMRIYCTTAVAPTRFLRSVLAATLRLSKEVPARSTRRRSILLF